MSGAPSYATPFRLLAMGAVLLLVGGVRGWTADAVAEQASEPRAAAAGGLDAGGVHSCAVLPAGSVRCWGFGAGGALGYASTETIGDDEPPATAGPVDLGSARTATAVATGDAHTCALLDDRSVRCWGFGGDGRLGYADTASVGDDEAPATVRPVDLGGAATAISAGGAHTCALLVDGSRRPRARPSTTASRRRASAPLACAVACDGVAGQARARFVGARRLRARARLRATRQIARGVARGRRRCLARHGSTPARVVGVSARAVSRTAVALRFRAAGTDGRRPPAARAYAITQSRTPPRTSRGVRVARRLCGGTCRFAVTAVGDPITLTVTHLRPGTRYSYVVTAHDNVSGWPGPRSAMAVVRTRP